MGTVSHASVIGALWLSALWAAAPAAAAGPAQGWRGDGSGRYPSADPPTTWGRVSKAVKDLRFQAAEPKKADTGTPMPDGVVRQWLILGAVPIPADEELKKELLPGEAALAPNEGDKTDRWTWKRATVDTAQLDFASLVGKRSDAAAYACTRVHCKSGGTFRVNLTSVGDVRVYVNGKPAGQGFVGRCKLELATGWNRLLLRVSPGENDWYVVPVFHAWQGKEADYERTNIAWRTALPDAWPGFYGGGMGVGSPVIVGDRLYLLCEPHDLVCIRKQDGKVLWVRRSSYFEVADEAERKHPAYRSAAAVVAKLDAIAEALVAGRATDDLFEEKIRLEKQLRKEMKAVDREKYKREPTPDVGFSGFTPATDGRFVYTWSASGIAACYDLAGNRKWIRLDRRPAVEHGFSSSPLLTDGKLVVFMRDAMAFDAATGKLAWQTPLVSHEGLNPAGFFHGSPVAIDVGGTAAIAMGNGTILRARDGKVLHTNRRLGNQAIASPVLAGRTLLFMAAWKTQLLMHELPDVPAEPLKLPTRELRIDMSAFPKHYLPWHLGSPVVHEHLAYLVNNAGVLSVVDLRAGQILYQKLLDLDVFQAHNEGAARGVGASPTLAGKYVYFLGNNGAAVVIEAGRTYRQVAKNKIESLVMARHWSQRQERFVASPVFDGRRLYLRGEGHLYAIGP